MKPDTWVIVGSEDGSMIYQGTQRQWQKFKRDLDPRLIYTVVEQPKGWSR